MLVILLRLLVCRLGRLLNSVLGRLVMLGGLTYRFALLFRSVFVTRLVHFRRLLRRRATIRNCSLSNRLLAVRVRRLV